MASPKTTSQDVGVAMRYAYPPISRMSHNTSITFRRYPTPIFRMKGHLLIVWDTVPRSFSQTSLTNSSTVIS